MEEFEFDGQEIQKSDSSVLKPKYPFGQRELQEFIPRRLELM
jgi:hypothetical protein